MISLPDLLGLVSVGTERTVKLSPDSLAVLFSALERVADISVWSGTLPDGGLSLSEVKTIGKLIDTALFELMSEADMHEIGEPYSNFVSTPKEGHLAMDGSTYQIADYPLLIPKIPELWVDVAEGTFFLPDMAARGIVGQGFTETTEAGIQYPVETGMRGGDQRVTLAVKNLPAHDHNRNPAGHGERVLHNTTIGTSTFAGSGNRLAVTGLEKTGSTGDDVSHQNMQPYLAAYWWMRGK